MKHSNTLKFLVTGLLFLGCNSREEVKVEKVQLKEVNKNTEVPIPIAPTGLKVSAYLIYNDGSISSFDVLNDRTKALWNTIIGAGDAEKPSTSSKIRLTGKLDSLNVKIFNGKRKVNDQQLPNFSGDFEFIIKNTGCEIVKIIVTKNNTRVFEGNIPFHCGE